MKLLGLLLAGVVIGILIAPEKGSETRKKLLGSFEDYKDEAQDFVKDASGKVKKAISEVKENVEDKDA